MFTESSNGGGFYPTVAYPCAGCGASIYTSNLLTLSNNHVSILCTACLHGTSAFPYQPAEPTLREKRAFPTLVNSSNLACQYHQEVNPISELFYNPSSTSVINDHLLVPKFRTENRDITQKDSIEIDSWLALDAGVHGEEQAKNIGPLYNFEANENLDVLNYWPSSSDQIEYQYLYDNLQQAFQQTESIVPVQAVEHSYYTALDQYEAFNANTFQTPSNRLTASVPCTDARLVPEATNRSYTNLDYMAREGTSAGSSSAGTGTAPHILPQYCPWIRKAKVLRYREKRKERKFQKKVRYSSRKAIAETRRRVRGRFAGRT